MSKLPRLLKIITPLIIMTLLTACLAVQDRTTQAKNPGEIDRKDPGSKVFIKHKSEEEIRKAYTEYLNNSVIDDKSRLDALTRLAELEYSSSHKLINPGDDIDTVNPVEEKLYHQRLERTIELLKTSIRDYPEAKENGILLYQLAKAQAQNDQPNQSIQSLVMLAEKYFKSPFYIEAQFRIAEDAFSKQNYSAAEYAYSEVINAPGNTVFYEKALFKRGWSRFKQRYYSEANDDFIEAINNHNFDAQEKLNTAEKEQFDEYFRSIALSFSYLNDPQQLASYFRKLPDFRYTYHCYEVISELFLKQERYSDAVATHRQFISDFPKSDNIPYSYLKIIEIWKNSGFNKKIYQAIEDFYVNYNPNSNYWINQNEDSKVNRHIRRALREYVVLMTAYYHNRYQSTAVKADVANAQLWYQRYLTHYAAYAQQDNIYFLYAELLTQLKQDEKAFSYYELAAFDNDLILNKEAAYAVVITSDKLFSKLKQQAYLDKHIEYSQKFAHQFTDDKRTYQVALHAAELAYNSKKYKETIELADLAAAKGQPKSLAYINNLKAASYFSLNEYKTAEEIYGELLKSTKPDDKQYVNFKDKLALSIYRQGEASQKSEDINRSIYHYARISEIVPSTTTAATGLYDAIALNIQHKQWNASVNLIQRFQKLYPRHKLAADVSKKLSLAYLSSNQGIKAAQEFEKIAQVDNNREVKAAALWQAAELYQEKNKTDDAIKAYKKYTEQPHIPYTQLLEASQKIAQLYASKGNFKYSNIWLHKILKADSKVLNNVKTDQSRQITSESYLALARFEKNRFDNIKLVKPLKKNLRNKKQAMQSSVELFAKASLNKIYPIATESTFSIGKIYRDFSKSLLNSERPDNLNDEELDQYEILLEDQAFPFEDKAIEFFEINLARIKEGLYNDWIQQSHQQLISLFPVRYDRKLLIDDYVKEIQ
jgi:cellulose synthase operon protein C